MTDLRSFRFLFLPAEHDPDSFIRAQGAEAFERCVTAAIPLSRQLLELAAEGADLATAEGRARMLAQARPLWNALPLGALRPQILADLAEAGRLPLDELSRLWGQSRPATPSPAASPRAQRARAPRPGSNVAVLMPQDHAARMLLRRAEWWHELNAADHELLTGLRSWHGALFRWLERDLTEHGARAWAGLREEIEAEPWADAARRLVDHAEVSVEPLLEELRGALAQVAIALLRPENDRLLGRG